METTLTKYRILNGSHLKLIAVITMFIDHFALILEDALPILQMPIFASFTLFYCMRRIGRLAFPLFCFLLTEGFVHTRSRLRYCGNLLAFALLSEIPYNNIISGNLLHPSTQNIYFTLLLGVLALWLLESPLKTGYKALILFPGIVLIPYLHVTYGPTGVLLIVLLYTLRQQPLLRALLALPFLSGGYAAWLAFVPMSLYNGQRGFIRGKVLKYAFYIFYPLHLLLLYGLKLLIRSL